MKTPIAILSLLLVLACGKRETPGNEPSSSKQQGMEGMAGMEDMPGMKGMAGMGADTAGIPLDRSQAARLGITFVRAEQRTVARTIRAAVTLKYAEPRLSYVNARVGGWVEQLYADYVGKAVSAGQPLLALYSPELVSAQEEYLLARRLKDDTLAAAALRRLALWDVAADQLDSLRGGGSVTRTILLRAPRSGEIVEKMVIEGQAIRAGDNLFQIADRRVMWAELAVFEQDAPAVKVGTTAAIQVEAVPGRTFNGRIAYIYPQVDPRSRTLTARVEVPNPGGDLRVGMYGTAELQSAGRGGVVVPLTAVLPTGTSDVVFVNRGDGRFLPREVQVAQRGDSTIEVVSGLKAGEEVVASATFLLDSEANLAAAIQGLMLQMGMGLNMGGMEMGKREEGKGKSTPDSMADMRMEPPQQGADTSQSDSVDMPGMPGMKMPRPKP